MSFCDATPLGRILSRVQSDLSLIDFEVAMKLNAAIGTIISSNFNFAVMAFLTWPVVFVIIPMIYLSIPLQRYYYVSAKEFMRISGTSKSSVASHLIESVAGAMTIRAFREEDRFFSWNVDLIDRNLFYHHPLLPRT